MGMTSENVLHCSLSLAPADRLVAEEQWAEISQQFMDQMGFTDTSGHAPARWVAIHHGPGKGGRDHIHIAASMVREDGTKWDGRWNDFPHAQQACRQLEKDHGLFQVQGRREQIRERGDRPGERETAARLNFDLTIPRELGQRLRQSAVASFTEDEFVRRARQNGLVMKPLYESGSTSKVRSYQAGLRPKDVQRRAAQAGIKVSRWASIRSAAMLGPDLALDRLRDDLWGPPGDAARAEWDAAFKGQPPANQNGREAYAIRADSAEKMAGLWSKWHDQLASVPAEDRHGWAVAARDVAGIMHGYARHSDRPDQIRHAADALSRSAKVVGRPPRDRSPVRPNAVGSAVGTGWLLASLHHDQKSGSRSHMLGTVVNQMIRTSIAIAEAHQARKAETEATRIHQRVIAPLRAEHTRMINDPGYEQARQAAQDKRLEQTLDPEALEAYRIVQAGHATPRRGAERGPNVLPADRAGARPYRDRPNQAPGRSGRSGGHGRD
jgi:hypothetical protein